MEWTLGSTPEFLIRMPNGFFYKGMEQGKIQAVMLPDKAFHFKSRLAAIQVAATTAQFAGAYIVPYNPPQSQPQA